MKDSFAQTYSQAPWRKQVQFIVLFSLVLVVIALVAGIYLNVSARAAAVGREIQFMQRRIDELDREIEDLQSQLAFAMSSDEMEKRAEEMGFRPVPADAIVYLPVQGYVNRQPVVLAPYSGRSVPSVWVMPPTYTESLFDWFQRHAQDLMVLVFGMQP